MTNGVLLYLLLDKNFKCGETDLKYIELLRKKLSSDIIHTSSLMLIVLII